MIQVHSGIYVIALGFRFGTMTKELHDFITAKVNKYYY